MIFTCLSIKAIHIEVVEELSSSSFINALRRFIAVGGRVSKFRSNRATNFVGCTKDLQIDSINVEDSDMKKFLFDKGTVWLFTPPLHIRGLGAHDQDYKKHSRFHVI